MAVVLRFGWVHCVAFAEWWVVLCGGGDVIMNKNLSSEGLGGG